MKGDPNQPAPAPRPPGRSCPLALLSSPALTFRSCSSPSQPLQGLSLCPRCSVPLSPALPCHRDPSPRAAPLPVPPHTSQGRCQARHRVSLGRGYPGHHPALTGQRCEHAASEQPPSWHRSSVPVLVTKLWTGSG